MNPYTILGVAKGATADTIKRAYKEKAKEHHPDRGGDSSKFAEVSNAYDILKDPNKRAYYDLSIPKVSTQSEKVHRYLNTTSDKCRIIYHN